MADRPSFSWLYGTGYTLDLGEPIQTVAEPPTRPATPVSHFDADWAAWKAHYRTTGTWGMATDIQPEPERPGWLARAIRRLFGGG